MQLFSEDYSRAYPIMYAVPPLLDDCNLWSLSSQVKISVYESLPLWDKRIHGIVFVRLTVTSDGISNSCSFTNRFNENKLN
jgi:hypothetical protein